MEDRLLYAICVPFFAVMIGAFSSYILQQCADYRKNIGVAQTKLETWKMQITWLHNSMKMIQDIYDENCHAVGKNLSIEFPGANIMNNYLRDNTHWLKYGECKDSSITHPNRHF